ncbi:MAG: CRISPR system precrRNA processing endoribonuclease RAMP protein Cas6 [Anaerolineae bacterium]|nr:CRISPR system precrRNA processing endoribonuclease RAMP protein Cas6 [Anaerolineae bacterium]
MDLLSLVLTLRPAREAALPPRLGRAAHAIVLARIAARDSALAEVIHAGDGPKPLTCSELIGGRYGERAVLPGQGYTLRYTALTAEVSAALSRAFAVGDTLAFEGVDFCVESLAPDPLNLSLLDSPTSASWAGADDYEDLAARHLLPSDAAPANRWSLAFTSPTAFRAQGRTVPLPLPGLVFGSLANRWNAFAPVALPADGVKRYAEEMVDLSRFSLRSAPGWDRGRGEQRGLRVGYIGKVTYSARNRDRYWLSVLGLLTAFACYSGVGVLTTMGMGQARET